MKRDIVKISYVSADTIIAILMVREKYKLIDTKIINEIVRDTIDILLQEGKK